MFRREKCHCGTSYIANTDIKILLYKTLNLLHFNQKATIYRYNKDSYYSVYKCMELILFLYSFDCKVTQKRFESTTFNPLLYKALILWLPSITQFAKSALSYHSDSPTSWWSLAYHLALVDWYGGLRVGWCGGLITVLTLWLPTITQFADQCPVLLGDYFPVGDVLYACGGVAEAQLRP